MRALALGLFGLFILACSSSSTGDEDCTNNGGVCNTSGQCSNQLPYPCDLGGVCCKTSASSDTATGH
jgi:hypothetical protein